MEKVTSDDMLNFRALHVNKAKFGSFCAAILSLLFSPYFSLVLQCNNVAYFARSFIKRAQWWNNNIKVFNF